MKTEKLVEQRLDELELKATDLLAKKKYAFRSNEGVEYLKLNLQVLKHGLQVS